MRKALLLLLVTALTLGTLAVAGGPASADATVEQEFLRLLNQTRATHGLRPMHLDAGLSHDARNWSLAMRAGGRLVHTPPLRMRDEVARAVPSWQRIGENIGAGTTAENLHRAFYGSTGHRANILADYNRVGIGVIRDGGRTWVTFRFVRAPTAAGPTGLEGAPPPPAVRHPDLTVCRGTIERRQVIHLRVPRRATCVLKHVAVTGDVKVKRKGRLRVESSQIRGDVTARKHRAVIVVDSHVRGMLQAMNGRRFTTKRTTVDRDLRAMSNRGRTGVRRNAIGGHLVCSTNSPAPRGGLNRVSGLRTDQCRAL